MPSPKPVSAWKHDSAQSRPALNPVNHLKMSYIVIEASEDRSSCRLDYRLVRFRSREPANRLHGLPQRKHDQLHTVFKFAAQQECSSMSFQSTNRWKYLASRVLNILARVALC